MKTRKDFEQTAFILSESISNPLLRYDVATAFAEAYKAENPRFNVDRFLGACKRDTDDAWKVENPFDHF